MFLHKSNFLMRAMYPHFVWRKSAEKKKIYLTFDDGPIPDVTEFVLETLEKYDAKATFFCIGDNIQKNFDIFNKIIQHKHAIGNHTFNHLNGWKTSNNVYFENTEDCQKLIEPNYLHSEKKLFRPPYGKIKISQSNVLLTDYQVVMWDVLSGDFSNNLSPQTVLQKTLRYTEAGSIVLFHDSLKANKNMSYALPRFLDHFSEQGFTFQSL